jgi:hypothetical protein
VAEFTSRIVSMRDGRIISDERNLGWRGMRLSEPEHERPAVNA